MTRMSEPHGVRGRVTNANSSKLLGRTRLAREVHDVCGAVIRASVFMVLTSSCVIPPNITVGDQDAGVNSPPAILAVRSDVEELAEPGPVVFDVGPTAGNLTIDLLDTDVADTLYVRVFVDYNLPDVENARATCTGVTSSTPQSRTATCDLRGLCKTTDVNKMPTPYMQVFVFDRMPLDSGAPAYMAMPPGGLSTSRGYFLSCRNPGAFAP